MKLLFSESDFDYSSYRFPYVIWGFREPGESVPDCFAAGFLPGNPELTRFYLCRHLRVELSRFVVSSENRRVLRKGEGIQWRLFSREKFDFSTGRREFCLSYAGKRFGSGVMTGERLDRLFRSAAVSHVLVFTETATGREVGYVALHLQEKELAFYYYGFYDVDARWQNLGLHMMTSAVKHFQEAGFAHVYLGTCYSEKALYKTQFSGLQFFDGNRWSGDLGALKKLVRRAPQGPHHLLEDPAWSAFFGDPGEMAAMSRARIERWR